MAGTHNVKIMVFDKLQQTYISKQPALHSDYEYVSVNERSDDEIASIWYDIATASFQDGIKYSASCFQERYMNPQMLSRDGVFIVQHKVSQDKVAFVFAWLPEPSLRRGQLHWLCVRPEHRGKGIASCLIDRVLSYFKDVGFDSVFLKTETFRLDAISLYKKFGFI